MTEQESLTAYRAAIAATDEAYAYYRNNAAYYDEDLYMPYQDKRNEECLAGRRYLAARDASVVGGADGTTQTD